MKLTRFQKYSLSISLTSVIGVPLFIWLVLVHQAYASEEQLTQAIERIQIQQRADRRRDLLKDNKRDLAAVNFRIYDLESRPEPDSAAYDALLIDLKADKAALTLDQGCIIATGKECEEDLEP